MPEQLFLFPAPQINIDIHELILVPDSIRVSEHKQSAQSEVTYELAMSMGPDCAVLRTKGGKRELLVLLVTQNQFYIKNLGSGRITPLSGSGLAAFFRDFRSSESIVPWLQDDLCNLTKRKGDSLLAGLDMPFLNELLRKGKVLVSVRNLDSWYVWRKCSPTDSDARVYREMVKHLSARLDDAKVREAVGGWLGCCHSHGTLQTAVRFLYGCEELSNVLCDAGIDTARKFMASFYDILEAGTPVSELSYAVRAVSRIKRYGLHVDYPKILRYIVRHIGALHDWWLYIQEIQDFMRLDDVYVDDPTSAYAEIRAKNNETRDRRIQEGFSRQIAEYGNTEYQDDEYIIRLPRTPAELVREGELQCHCVGQAVPSHANGSTRIYLMRKVSEPDEPFVTVEVKNGRLRQAHLSHNRNLGASLKRWLVAWCRMNGIKVTGNMDAVRGV